MREVHRLTQRLFELWDEKREALAGDQEAAWRRALADPLSWSGFQAAPTSEPMVGGADRRVARARLDEALRRFESAAA